MLFQKHHMTGLTGLMSAHCSATAPMHRFRGPFQDNHIWPCTWIRVVESEVLPALPPRTEGFSTPLCFHQPCLVSLLKSLRSIIVPTDSSESLWGETSRWNKEKRTHLYPAVHRGVEEPQWVIQHDNRNPLHCSLHSRWKDPKCLDSRETVTRELQSSLPVPLPLCGASKPCRCYIGRGPILYGRRGLKNVWNKRTSMKWWCEDHVKLQLVTENPPLGLSERVRVPEVQRERER